MDLYLRLIAAVEIQVAVAIMAAPSMARIYISATADKMAKPLATMFPMTRRHRSAKELRPGLNSRIVCVNLPPSIRSASFRPSQKNNNHFRNRL